MLGLSLLSNPLTKYAVGALGFAVVLFGIYTYVNYTQGKIETLTRQNVELRIQVDQYKKAIEELRLNYEKKIDAINGLFDGLISSGLPLEKIKKFFEETDFSSLSDEDLEKLINSVQVDTNRCLEVISGDVPQPGEKNSLCPELFSRRH